VEQRAEAFVGRAVAAHGRDVEIEPPQRGQRGVPPLAHDVGAADCPAGGVACPVGGGASPAGGAAFSTGGGAFAGSARRPLPWAPSQCGSHHSVASTCTPSTILL